MSTGRRGTAKPWLPAASLSFTLVAALACGSTDDPAAQPPPPRTADDAGAPATPDAATAEAGGCGKDVTPGPGVVVTDLGGVRGVREGSTWAYKNLPFAAPPLGALRWKPPAPAACWSGIRDASAWGPRCPQSDVAGTAPVSGDEDCLQLNVWTPDGASASAPAPIMFWIHGGGHVIGSAGEESSGVRIYEGSVLAGGQQVVVISTNYRLGALGFLAHPALVGEEPNQSTGNYALLDMIAALRWVQANAKSFGGDPASVTIFGESAGGVNVCALLASPLAKGLFHRAIIQSGGCTARPRADAEAAGAKLVAAAKCDGPDPIACMRALPAAEVISTIPTKVDVAGASAGYGPTIDPYVLPEAPLAAIAAGRHAKVPTIVGANANETSRAVPLPRTATEVEYQAAVRLLFTTPAVADAVLAQYPAASYASPWAAYVAVTSDAKFICGARKSLRALVAGGTTAYRYHFTHALDNAPLLKPFGAWHGADVLYVFGHIAFAGYTPGGGDAASSTLFMESFGRFARTGDPGNATTTWPVYGVATDPYIQIDAPAALGAGVRTTQCDFWDALLP